MRLLLVEDSVAVADQLLPLLRDHGYAVDWRADGRDALVRAHDDDFDLVILDLGLPGLDGLEVLRRWREQGLSMPAMIPNARDSWAEPVDGCLCYTFVAADVLLFLQLVALRSVHIILYPLTPLHS